MIFKVGGIVKPIVIVRISLNLAENGRLSVFSGAIQFGDINNYQSVNGRDKASPRWGVGLPLCEVCCSLVFLVVASGE